MKRHKAHNKHPENQEDISTQFFFVLNGFARCFSSGGPPSEVRIGSSVGFVQFLGDQSVAYNDGRQVAPENHLTHIIYHFVPKQSCLCLQVAARETWRRRGFTCKDHVGQAQEKQDDPNGRRQKFPARQSGRVSASEGIEGLSAAIDADEAEEEDADVHCEVKQHRGNSAHKYPQADGCQVGVWQYLEEKKKYFNLNPTIKSKRSNKKALLIMKS